ncbi:Hypothetical protein R9X50_00436500 [Acrodontium crateriforme]|uniref:CRAL-TRIO domain-containing protein n=1 Tax=Acrodontium crateriforme TaxID=150365 RepID=A0AAQ3M4L2_9PEZI|nr:Hypothetical protein R9X50_00436500 [Acrodontium crateriforme]
MASTSISAGRAGNLTSEQETKLKEMWARIGEITGVYKDETDSANSDDSGYDSNSSASATATAGNDKHGQTKQFQDLIKSQSPEAIRAAAWSFIKHDNPDDGVLRFLRARKWDVNAAVVMLMGALHWRTQTAHLDDDIMLKGEGGALAVTQSTSATSTEKKLAEDYLNQLRMGKSFLHNTDKEGRPIAYVRVRLHRSSQQSNQALERFIIHFIETSRFVLKPPVDTATIVFDMTNFGLANMDYTPVKLIIQCFEANYPESLGAILIYKAPWIFQGIWRVIRGWLDPVVAGKVHFCSNIKELEAFIAKDKIIKELGGPEDFEYKYVEPVEGENAKLLDTTTRDAIQDERNKLTEAFDRATVQWVRGGNDGTERTRLASLIEANYWKLDPYIRARSVYDRNGTIRPSSVSPASPQQQQQQPPTHTPQLQGQPGHAEVGPAGPPPPTAFVAAEA